jgi:hypothetical protein
MSRIALRDRAREVARVEIGVREHGRNAGPRVEQYLRAVGLPAGNPWCMAFVVWAYDQAALELDLLNPLPRTARVSTMARLSQSHWRSALPSLGAIYLHLHDPSDPKSLGHTGIVDEILLGRFRAIEGNTDGRGSRTGGQVLEQTRPLGYATVFLDIGREGPSELPRHHVS